MTPHDWTVVQANVVMADIRYICARCGANTYWSTRLAGGPPMLRIGGKVFSITQDCDGAIVRKVMGE